MYFAPTYSSAISGTYGLYSDIHVYISVSFDKAHNIKYSAPMALFLFAYSHVYAEGLYHIIQTRGHTIHGPTLMAPSKGCTL